MEGKYCGWNSEGYWGMGPVITAAMSSLLDLVSVMYNESAETSHTLHAVGVSRAGETTCDNSS